MRSLVPVFASILLLGLAVLSAGCSTAQFGDVWYENGSLSLTIQNDGEPRQIGVQVTVFDLSNFRQVELGKYVQAIDLKAGTNVYQFPVVLSSGPYKLWLYSMEEGERTGCQIKNIDVLS